MSRAAPVVILAAILLVMLWYAVPTLQERIALMVRPSAARAFSYGMQHFDSQTPDEYDIAAAEYFFERVVRLEPAYPLAHQQLARILFLNGDYEEALEEINIEISNNPNTKDASSFYIRGLIEGYLKQYDAAVRDYGQTVLLDPTGWESRTDYAWVLIKTGDPGGALEVVEQGLVHTPDNPWLLSMRATALFELGDIPAALPAARRAAEAVGGITEAVWLDAYPGNAPEAAAIGIQTLRAAAQSNLRAIEAAAATSVR